MVFDFIFLGTGEGEVPFFCLLLIPLVGLPLLVGALHE